MSSTPTLNQVHYRVRTDTATVDTAPTWAAAEDTNVSLAVETTFRIRFVVQNTGTGTAAGPFILRVSKNAGAYTAVTTTSGATLGAQSADASTSADNTSITVFRLTAGAGSGASSSYDETGSITSTLTNGFYCEFEFGLILKTAGAAAGNTFDFRLYNNTTAFTTYTQTPRITVLHALLANDVSSASNVAFVPRALATGTYFNETSLVTSTYSHYSAVGHTTSVVTVAANGGAAIGDLAVLAFATDNSDASTASGIQSIADSKGNTWINALDADFDVSGSGTGSNAGIFRSQLTTALAPADTITVTWRATTGDRDAVAVAVKMFSVAAGRTVSLDSGDRATGNASQPPSLNNTTADVECLRIRITGFESNANQLLNSPGWVQLPGVIGNSGTSLTSQALSSEFKISTGTSDASTPEAGATVDMASVYVAFKTTGAVASDDLLANDISSASSVTQPALVTPTVVAAKMHHYRMRRTF